MKRTALVVSLLAVFLVSLLFNELILWHFSSWMNQNDESKLGFEIVKVHSMPLGLLLGTIFAVKKAGGKVSILQSFVAIIVSVTWVLLITASWHGYPQRIYATYCTVDSHARDCPSVESNLSNRAAEISFLTAGVFAFLLGKPPENR